MHRRTALTLGVAGLTALLPAVPAMAAAPPAAPQPTAADVLVVRRFLRAFAGGPSGIQAALRALATSDVTWASSGFETVVGLPASIDYIGKYSSEMGFTAINIAVNDAFIHAGKVWTDRVDTTVVPVLSSRQDPDGLWPDRGDGQANVADDVIGKYTLRDHKICAIEEIWNPGRPGGLLAYLAARNS